MATYPYTYYITYLNGSYDSDAAFVDTFIDSEQDTTFEVNDPASAVIGNYIYVGTTVVDGEVWPVFDFIGPPNGYSVVAMTQVPTVVPPSLSLTAQTFDTVCFAAGTRIACPDGETPVETLGIGDLVLDHTGAAVPVRWIGRQTLNRAFGPQMVRIRAGALGESLPHSDLTVTGDHGMVLDGHIINASALVNGDSIGWVPMADLPESFTVYHVETEGHEVILANGAPSETFIDYRDRRAFDNFDEYLDLYGAERIIPEMPRPRISSARHLPEALAHRLRGTAPQPCPENDMLHRIAG